MLMVNTKEYMKKEEILTVFEKISEYNLDQIVNLYKKYPCVEEDIKEILIRFQTNRKIIGRYFRGIETRKVTEDTLAFARRAEYFTNNLDSKEDQESRIDSVKRFFNKNPISDSLYDYLYNKTYKKILQIEDDISKSNSVQDSLLNIRFNKRNLQKILNEPESLKYYVKEDVNVAEFINNAKYLVRNWKLISKSSNRYGVSHRDLLALQMEIVDIRKKLFKMKDKVIFSHIQLAEKYTQGFKDRGISIDDLRQEAIMGIIKASNRFDHRMGNTFSTYATQWINQKLREVCKTTHIVSPPSVKVEKAKKLNHSIQAFQKEYGRLPSLEEIKKMLKEKDSLKAIEILNLTQKDASLDYIITEDSHYANSFVDTLSDDDETEMSFNSVENELIAKRLQEGFSCLNDDETKVMRMVYGLGCEQEYSKKVICERLSMSAVELKKIEESAKDKLKSFLSEDMLSA